MNPATVSYLIDIVFFLGIGLIVGFTIGSISGYAKACRKCAATTKEMFDAAVRNAKNTEPRP